MVYRSSAISVSNSIDQSKSMAVTMNLTDQCLKSRQINQIQKNKKVSKFSSNHLKTLICSESESGVVDLVILIAVICALGFLFYPYVKFTYTITSEFAGCVVPIVKEELLENPIIYGALGLGMVCVGLASWAIVMCMSQKCGNPGCRGLRGAAEFDVQLETEDRVKNSNSLTKEGVKKGLFELPRDHHRELEAELKKIAPPNGRAVLVFRARCGCSVGRMEVPGPRKPRKIKK